MPLVLNLLDSDTSIASGNRSGLSWHDSDFFAVASFVNPKLHMFPWDGTSIGADANLNDPDNPSVVTISHNGLYIAVAEIGLQTLKVYNFTAGAFGTLIDTSAAWTGSVGCHGIAWSPDDDFLYVSHNAGDFLFSVSFDGASLGSLVLPATPPDTVSHSPAFQAVEVSPNGDFLAFAQEGGNFLVVYPISAGVFGTPFAPSSAINASVFGGTSVSWTPDSNFVALAVDDEPFVAVYPRTGVTLGAAIVPAMVSAGSGIGYVVKFDKNGTALFLGGNVMDNNRNLYGYTFTGSALTGRIDPDISPGDHVRGLDISADNTVIATYDSDADIDVYETGLVLFAGEHFVVSNRTLRFQDGEIEVEAELVAQDWLGAIQRGL